MLGRVAGASCSSSWIVGSKLALSDEKADIFLLPADNLKFDYYLD